MSHHGDQPIKPGPTGRFPQGKLSEDDEGELAVAVATDPVKKLVCVDFGKPIKWVAMNREQALSLAALLVEKASSLPTGPVL